ncbi:U6 snRNA-associated Sm-like protein LSm2 [Actinomortierella ambigua]|nr:U6 snRNA-associated Sm-like protein LSm2 [Actinomortierella ambigua]
MGPQVSFSDLVICKVNPYGARARSTLGQQVTVELKNDLAITGLLVSVDQFLNIKLDNIKVVEESRYPHMMAVKNCFIRGSVVRYVQLPAASVDTALLQDAARRERQQQPAGRK